jgi:hypothetical protein
VGVQAARSGIPEAMNNAAVYILRRDAHSSRGARNSRNSRPLPPTFCPYKLWGLIPPPLQKVVATVFGTGEDVCALDILSLR